MMTKERAAELVGAMPSNSDHKIDLFDHFVRYFDLTDKDEMEDFAVDCGFMIATCVQPIK